MSIIKSGYFIINSKKILFDLIFFKFQFSSILEKKFEKFLSKKRQSKQSHFETIFICRTSDIYFPKSKK